MKTILFISFAFFLFAGSTFAQVNTSKSVFQSWNEVQLILPLVRAKDAQGKSFDKFTAIFNGVARIGRKEFDFLDDRAGLTLDYRAGKYLSVFAGVLYRRDEIVKNIPRYETRLTAGATISKIWKEFSFRDRNMFEHRFRSGRGELNLYRQRIQIAHPIKINKKEIFSPFISEEAYYEITSRKWVQNEFYAGITRKINSKMALDLAYLRNDSKPANVNGLSLNLRIRLR